MATMTARRVHIVSFPFIFIVFIVNALSGESVVLRFFSGLECAPNTASVRPIAGYLDEIVEEWRKNRCTALLQLAQLFRETLHKSQPRARPTIPDCHSGDLLGTAWALGLLPESQVPKAGPGAPSFGLWEPMGPAPPAAMARVLRLFDLVVVPEQMRAWTPA
jgi:hypothetical protein